MLSFFFCFKVSVVIIDLLSNVVQKAHVCIDSYTNPLVLLPRPMNSRCNLILLHVFFFLLLKSLNPVPRQLMINLLKTIRHNANQLTPRSKYKERERERERERENMDATQSRLSILMLPWLAHAHISPFLEPSKKLTERNFHIYFCSTPINLDSHQAKNF